MVRGLFLSPADGPSSSGGEGWQPSRRNRFQLSEDANPIDGMKEENVGDSANHPANRKSVADIIAACEALEKRTKELQQLAAKSPAAAQRTAPLARDRCGGARKRQILDNPCEALM